MHWKVDVVVSNDGYVGIVQWELVHNVYLWMYELACTLWILYMFFLC